MHSDQIEHFITQLQSNDQCYTYEFSTPLAFSFSSHFQSLYDSSLLPYIDAFVCTDSPLAKLKHHASLAALKIQTQFQKPTITTLSMRDKNSLALQSELIGMNDLDLRLILALTGDPLRLGNQPQSKPVLEGSSQLLLKIIKALNTKHDLNANPIAGDHKTIYPFSVLNAYAKNKDNLYRKMYNKIKNGSLALFTQPIYDIHIATQLLQTCQAINQELNTRAVLVLGFFPLFSYKTALFLDQNLPGAFIPPSWLEQMQKASQNQTQEQVALKLNTTLFASLKSLHNKFHLMSLNKPHLMHQIIKNTKS